MNERLPIDVPIDFLWPDLLWLLLVLPALLGFYLWLLRRRRRFALTYASLALLRPALAGRAWRRHLPPLLFLLALALMLLAAARPVARITLPQQEETIILAIDVSGSMRARDVEPTRLEAAQNAAREFIGALPRRTQVGVVAFAATAALVQPPTASREDALAAIDRLQLQRGTATGSGIMVALAALFPDAGYEADTATRRDPAQYGAPLDAVQGAATRKAPDLPPAAPGSYAQAAVILLSDGQRTTGPDPVDAARLAAERGLRIYTVGIGTAEGEVISFEGWSFRARLDEDALKAVAGVTQAQYFYAADAAELKNVYRTLSARLVLQKKETEVSAVLAGAAALFALLAALLSMLWFNRLL